MQSTDIYQHVEDHYGSIARAENSTTYSSGVAKAFGYSEGDVAGAFRDANLGLSCGNPLAIATLREGETVVDLGSGAGFDVFLAAEKVGKSGKVIGVDMNKDMLSRARKNEENWGSEKNASVTFVESNITSIPLDDGIADCIISNCVINLVPDAEKPTVFTEMARLLKHGGRVAISDILARKTMPKSVREDVALYVGCVAGASTKEEYTQYLENAGFNDILIVDTESDLNVYMTMAKGAEGVGCCGSTPTNGTTGDGCTAVANATATCCSTVQPGNQNTESDDSKAATLDLNEWAGSFKILASKA